VFFHLRIDHSRVIVYYSGTKYVIFRINEYSKIIIKRKIVSGFFFPIAYPVYLEKKRRINCELLLHLIKMLIIYLNHV